VRSSLTIGGIEVELRIPAGNLEAIVAARYAPFLGAVREPVCRLAMDSTGVVDGEPNPPLATLTGAGTDVVEVKHPDFTGTFALEGDGWLTVADNEYTVDHAFRVLFGLLAPRHDALMLHSCGLISGAVANVFAGESGAGKSTLASMGGSRPLLSDEHVLVRRTAQEWVAASTPFWGSYAKPGPARQAPLARLWSLQQWPKNEVVAADAERCLRTALDNAVLPCAEPAIKSAVFDVAFRLADEVPASVLRFALDEEVWELIDARAAVA
jgi:hypothetical protein